MRTESMPGPCPEALDLQVGCSPETGNEALACFAFDGSHADSCSPGLDFLGGSLACEYWWGEAPVSAGKNLGVHWRQSGNLLFLAYECPDPGKTDPASLAERGYTGLLEVAAQCGCPNLLRAWNYLPGINQGEGDDERYRRFCLGRSQALKRAAVRESELCAGTAIGGDEPNLRIYALAGRGPGINIENPRQVSAYRYPRTYGPRSPSFARATAVIRADGQALLMVSGTASVVGHETRHEGDLDAQLDEIIVNLKALLAESARRLHRPGLADFDRHSLFRAYVRHCEHWPRVRARLADEWPASPVAGLRGDICRADLLVELEVVTGG